MASISFIYPQYLFFILLIPLFIFIHLATLKSTKSSALKFANFEAISRIRGVDLLPLMTDQPFVIPLAEFLKERVMKKGFFV